MSLVATLLERIQPNYTEDFDKNELRRSNYGALETFSRDTNSPIGILTPDVKMNIMNSFGRKGGVVIPAIDSDTVTIGNTRSCTVALDENDSQEFVLTFATFAWGFTMFPTQYIQNEVGYVADFDRKMRKYMTQFLKDLDSKCVAQLELDKNQVYPTDITNIFPVLADALRVSLADAQDAYNNVETIANVQDYEGPFNVIASSTHRPIISRLTNQGQGNAINETFQFGPYEYSYSNRVTSGAGVKSTSYVTPKGNLAIMNRNDWDSKTKQRSTDGHIWDEVELPMSIPMSGSNNIKVGTLHFSNCANAVGELGSALGGQSEASLKEAFLFSTDVVTLTAFSSDRSTIPGPAQKYEFLTS